MNGVLVVVFVVAVVICAAAVYGSEVTKCNQDCNQGRNCNCGDKDE